MYPLIISIREMITSSSSSFSCFSCIFLFLLLVNSHYGSRLFHVIENIFGDSFVVVVAVVPFIRMFNMFHCKNVRMNAHFN